MKKKACAGSTLVRARSFETSGMSFCVGTFLVWQGWAAICTWRVALSPALRSAALARVVHPPQRTHRSNSVLTHHLRKSPLDRARTRAIGRLCGIRSQATLRPHLNLFFERGGIFRSWATGVASVLGFFYWWFAARGVSSGGGWLCGGGQYPGMNFIGHVGEIGLGALLIGDVHRFRERSSSLISGALVVSASCSALLGLGYIAISAIFPVQLGDIAKGWGDVVLILGCAPPGPDDRSGSSAGRSAAKSIPAASKCLFLSYQAPRCS